MGCFPRAFLCFVRLSWERYLRFHGPPPPVGACVVADLGMERQAVLDEGLGALDLLLGLFVLEVHHGGRAVGSCAHGRHFEQPQCLRHMARLHDGWVWVGG